MSLNAAATAVVDKLIAGMTEEQLVGQLLCVYHRDPDARTLADGLERIGVQPGAVLLMSRTTAQAAADTRALQDWSDTPLLVAANLESGTAGFLTDGQTFANPMQVAATGDPEHARRLGAFCAAHGRSVGVNWAFAPVADIVFNAANPITGTRTFGSEPQVVAAMAAAYVDGLQRGGVAATVKHWPGDGVDSRDQHLLTSINSLSGSEWRATYGEVFREVFKAGALSVMAGHIALPSISATDSIDQGRHPIPASQNPALLSGLLRDELGFDGLVVSDNTTMAGFTRFAPRERAVVDAVNAGCDMLLGAQFTDHDFAALLQAVRTGAISSERLQSAVRRVLAMKAKLGLLDPTGALAIPPVPPAEWSDAVARDSVTLVRDDTVLPITGSRYPRALVYVLGDQPTFYEPTGGFAEAFTDGLRHEGIEVDVRTVPAEGRTAAGELDAQTAADIVIYFANCTFTSDSNISRITWSYPQAPEVPRAPTVPVVLISIANPFHLQDLPSADAAINAYCPSPQTVRAVLESITGRAPFRGTSPVDAFTGS